MTETEINARDAAADRVLERVVHEKIDLVRFLYADHGGVIRGKAASRSRLAERMRTGIGHTVAMMAMPMLDELQPVEGMGPVGEIRLVPDPTTFVSLPYAPGAGAMVADMVRLDGQPWEACPRAFLTQAVADLAAEGYTLVAAFEPEFTLGHRTADEQGGPDRLEPVDDSLCYSATGFHLVHDYTIDLVQALEAQGLRVEHYYPELGHGQQELSIRHTPALRAADSHLLYRETVRGVAFRYGLWASLAPKPIPDQAGNGAHLHASLWEAGPDGEPGDRNALHDPNDAYGLSEIGHHFLAGVLTHLPGLLALTSASVNSYRRLAPQMWASAYTCYGMDNREAAVRICSPLWADVAGSTNLEFKPADSTANPYLALGAYIHAGLDGIRRKLDPGEPMNIDPATLSDDDRAARGIRRYPTSLESALAALEADELLMEALGPLRRRAYFAVKRGEVAGFAGRDAAFEAFHYFTKF